MERFSVVEGWRAIRIDAAVVVAERFIFLGWIRGWESINADAGWNAPNASSVILEDWRSRGFSEGHIAHRLYYSLNKLD